VGHEEGKRFSRGDSPLSRVNTDGLFKKIWNAFKCRCLRHPRNERVSINFFGKIYIGFTLLVGFAAVNTGNNILYILLSFLLALMGVSGFLSRYNLRGLKIHFSPPNEVWCCKPSTFEVFIRNLKKLPSFLLTVYDESLHFKASTVMVEREGVAKTELVFPKRGLYRIEKIRVESTFPFALFKRSWDVEVGEEILVFPKPKEVKIPASVLNSSKSLREGFLSLKVRKAVGDTVEGLREYSGEGLNLIDWKVFARLGEFFAKELSSEEIVREVTVEVDKIPGTDKEDKISKATYLVLKFRKLGYAVGLKFGDKEIPPAVGDEHFVELLRFLALA